MLNEKEKERKKGFSFIFFSIVFKGFVSFELNETHQQLLQPPPSSLDCQFARMKYEPTLISPTDKALFSILLLLLFLAGGGGGALWSTSCAVLKQVVVDFSRSRNKIQ